MGAVGKSRAGLDKLVATHGAALVLAALKSFYNRSGGFGGVNNAYALFLSEADDHMAHVKHQQLEFMDAEARNKAAADRHADEISMQRQAAENWKRLTTAPSPRCPDADILSLLGVPDDYEEFK
jgi:hypothetical protein